MKNYRLIAEVARDRNGRISSPQIKTEIFLAISANSGLISTMKTIREIWNETPTGNNIVDPCYLTLGDYIERQAKISIVRFGKVYFKGDFFSLTPLKAIKAFDKWLDEMRNDLYAWREFQKAERDFNENASVSDFAPPLKL